MILPSGMNAAKAAQRLRNFPGLKPIFKYRYEAIFRRNSEMQLFRGTYPTYDAAAASAPSAERLGYDQTSAAGMYRDKLQQVEATDYPVLFWMSRILTAGRLFDFGGHIGVKYYSYRKYLTFPAGLIWEVCDVPAVTEAGRALATEQGVEGSLRFTNDVLNCSGAGLLFCSGSLQYVEWPLHAKLALVEVKPRHVIVNTTPLTDHPTFFTLNGIGTAFCPYRAANRAEFFSGMFSLGYELVDEWSNPGKQMHIPFHEHLSLDRYTGCYLRLRDG